jgi:hypothetical protein
MLSAKSFDAHDKLICPQCGGQMLLVRRMPNPAVAHSESQLFACNICPSNVQRNIDSAGQIT